MASLNRLTVWSLLRAEDQLGPGETLTSISDDLYPLIPAFSAST